MSRPRSRDDLLEVSLACTAEIAFTGYVGSVDRLAAAAGISPRTFHRYFPRKEDCIRPAFADARSILADALVAHDPADSLAHAFLAAFHVAAGGAFAERTARLVPVIASDTALSAVWDSEFHEGEAPLAEAIARRSSTPLDATALSSAAILLAMARLSFAQLVAEGGDIVELLRARLDALPTLGLFDPERRITPRRAIDRPLSR